MVAEPEPNLFIVWSWIFYEDSEPNFMRILSRIMYEDPEPNYYFISVGSWSQIIIFLKGSEPNLFMRVRSQIYLWWSGAEFYFWAGAELIYDILIIIILFGTGAELLVMRVQSRILFWVRSWIVSYEGLEPNFISGPEPNYYFILIIIILLFLTRLCWAAVSQRPRRTVVTRCELFLLKSVQWFIFAIGSMIIFGSGSYFIVGPVLILLKDRHII